MTQTELIALEDIFFGSIFSLDGNGEEIFLKSCSDIYNFNQLLVACYRWDKDAKVFNLESPEFLPGEREVYPISCEFNLEE